MKAARCGGLGWSCTAERWRWACCCPARVGGCNRSWRAISAGRSEEIELPGHAGVTAGRRHHFAAAAIARGAAGLGPEAGCYVPCRQPVARSVGRPRTGRPRGLITAGLRSGFRRRPTGQRVIDAVASRAMPWSRGVHAVDRPHVDPVFRSGSTPAPVMGYRFRRPNRNDAARYGAQVVQASLSAPRIHRDPVQRADTAGAPRRRQNEQSQRRAVRRPSAQGDGQFHRAAMAGDFHRCGHRRRPHFGNRALVRR